MAENDAPELKPCPFCGSNAESTGVRHAAQTLQEYLVNEPYVRCSNGQCAVRYVPAGMTVSDWNTRADLAAPATQKAADFQADAEWGLQSGANRVP